MEEEKRKTNKHLYFKTTILIFFLLLLSIIAYWPVKIILIIAILSTLIILRRMSYVNFKKKFYLEGQQIFKVIMFAIFYFMIFLLIIDLYPFIGHYQDLLIAALIILSKRIIYFIKKDKISMLFKKEIDKGFILSIFFLLVSSYFIDQIMFYELSGLISVALLLDYILSE